MMKNKFWSILLLVVMSLPMIIACGSNDDDEDTVSVSLTETNLTEDGYFDGMLYYKITSNSPLEVAVNKADNSVVNVEIPSTVSINGKKYKCTSIGKNAFYGSNLVSISFPNTITSIGYNAFEDCYNLDKVIVKDITTWCGISFADLNSNPCCKGGKLYSDEGTMMTKLSIPNTVASINDYAFFGCSSLTSIIIPSSVTSIGNRAFYYCTSLTSITIPNSVTSIGDFAFSGCSQLTSITIPNSITNIGNGTFSGCSSLSNFSIPNSIVSIGDNAFKNCGLTCITIPSSINSIGSDAFARCEKLQKVIVIDIAAWCGITFKNKNSNPLTFTHHLYIDENKEITNLNIPNNVTSIGNYAFSGCSELIDISIPNSVTTIGYNAFADCTALSSITIPQSVTDLEHAFDGCINLKKVVINTSIVGSCFREFSSIENVELGDNVNVIASSAFYRCTGLKSVFIPNSLDRIEESAFSACYSLKSVTIPNSVTRIGGSVFQGCSGLIDVTIGESVTYLGNYVFRGCSALTSIHCKSKTPIDLKEKYYAGNYYFDSETFSKAILYVPKGSLDAYRSANGWMNFKNIVEE